jgi:DNA glycosylase AlkZ-like
MISLNWAQVNGWRLSQHNLSHRLQHQDFVQAVGQSLGIHAQVMSSAELAIAARVDGLAPHDVERALWQEHTLVKTWAMRQTLHLLPAADFPMYIAARRMTDINWPKLFNQHGIDQATFEAYMAVTPEILSSQPLARQQFTQAVDERLKSPELYNFLVNGSWGSVF